MTIKLADKVFVKKYDLRGSDFDSFGQIKPSAVLDLFQDAAGIHAVQLGVGFESFLEKGLLWVVMKVKYAVIAPPEKYGTVKVFTWPKEPHRLDYVRNYKITDESGRVLIKGTSQWAVINSESRKLTRVNDVYSALDSFSDEDTFDEKLVRVSDFECGIPAYKAVSGFTDIDFNGHVNNARYADYCINALNAEEPLDIKQFQIDFHREITCGDVTDIYTLENEGEILIKGMQNENIMFSCRIER